MAIRQKCFMWALSLALGMAAASAGAQTTIAGIKYEPEVSLGGQKLLLNGAGVRFRAVFKVYAAGLYTPGKITENEDVIKTSTASRLHLVALRDVGGEEFGKLFVRGMEANATREEFAKSISSVVRMGQIFSDAKLFKQGDVILMDYVPGTGTVISHKGKPLGDAFKEADFHSLLMKIWFGPKPADEALRGALLGQKTSANSNVN